MPVLSDEARQRLAAELGRINTEQLPAARDALAEARAAGDIGENPDVFVVLEAEGRLLRRVQELEALLSGVSGPAEVGTWPFGTVAVLDFGDGPERFIYGSIEERPHGMDVVTATSPLGKALGAAEKGSVVSYETPHGARVEVTVVDVVFP